MRAMNHDEVGLDATIFCERLAERLRSQGVAHPVAAAVAYRTEVRADWSPVAPERAADHAKKYPPQESALSSRFPFASRYVSAVQILPAPSQARPYFQAWLFGPPSRWSAPESPAQPDFQWDWAPWSLLAASCGRDRPRSLLRYRQSRAQRALRRAMCANSSRYQPDVQPLRFRA